MVNEEKIEPRTIRILGKGIVRNHEIERYRDFLCYGRRNVEKICGACALRFQCFSTRDDVEIPVRVFGKKSIKDVTVKMVANKFSGLKYKFKGAENLQEKDRVQIDFNKAVLKNDV